MSLQHSRDSYCTASSPLWTMADAVVAEAVVVAVLVAAMVAAMVVVAAVVNVVYVQTRESYHSLVQTGIWTMVRYTSSLCGVDYNYSHIILVQSWSRVARVTVGTDLCHLAEYNTTKCSPYRQTLNAHYSFRTISIVVRRDVSPCSAGHE
eukprot:scpid104672/ scgid23417/ 